MKTHLTPDDLKRYQSGEMTHQEMHQVEKILLEQPFYAEALEGLQAIKKDNVSTEKNFDDLKSRLQQRTKKTERKEPDFTIIKLWKPISIAASVLIVLFGSIYFFNQKTEDSVAAVIESKRAESTQAEPILDSTISIKKSTDETIAFNEKQKVRASKRIEQSSKTAAYQQAERNITPQNDVAANAVEETEKAADRPQPVAAPYPSSAEKKEEAREEAVVAGAKPGAASRMSTGNVSGTVVNNESEAMEGVAINIKGTAHGTKTDKEGKFYIEGLKRGDVLELHSLHKPSLNVLVKGPVVGKIVYIDQNSPIGNEPKIIVGEPTTVFGKKNFVEAKPEFGWNAYTIYLKENIKTPTQALKEGIKGKVTVRFKVNENGDLSDFQIVKGLGYGCDEEAIRLIKEGPKWFPATQDDKKTNSIKQLIIRF